MKKLIIAAIISLSLVSLNAQVQVNGYYKSNGTYVDSYQRTSPNSTTLDNYSTKGNTNPYTGKIGTKDAYGNSSSNLNTNNWNSNNTTTKTTYSNDLYNSNKSSNNTLNNNSWNNSSSKKTKSLYDF